MDSYERLYGWGWDGVEVTGDADIAGSNPDRGAGQLGVHCRGLVTNKSLRIGDLVFQKC